VRVLIFHGYLLRGTGSNVYNASLARALAAMGHEVHLLCQDRRADELEWVDSVGGPGRPGAVTVHIPDIGGLLPVYVADRYEGFEVKTFAQLSDAELDRYLSANVEAVSRVIREAGAPDAALANHLVMGPAILARAGLRFAAAIHGSALEYTVKTNPERFLPYASEGMAAAAGVLVGSRHTAESLWAAMGEGSLPGRTRLLPPGVDTRLFAPLAATMGEGGPRDDDLRNATAPDPAGERLRLVARAAHDNRDDRWGRDPSGAAEAIEWFASGRGPRVVFVGKLIVAKGIDLLLAAWPLVVAANPGARLLVIGFGEYREGVERLWAAIEGGDLEAAREIARRGRELEGGPEGELEMLSAFLADPPEGWLEAGKAAVGSVRLCGRLEHEEVGALVPATDALVFPSTFPEAFGMVAAEAAAAGALPVSAAHSGLAEVSRELAATLPEAASGLVSFELGDGAIEAIAARLNGWLALDEATRNAARAALRETVARLWSWEGVARGVLAASAGRLDEIPQVPEGI
jgi:glycosyltransferase involved in cell wall biosynthesis